MATSRPGRYFPDELPAAARSIWNFTKGAGGSAEHLGHQITFVGLVLAASRPSNATGDKPVSCSSI
ncbi:Putative YrbE family protein [Mycobacteroides abscessus subsp. massiliense]|nr:Putative YrbE family protein [Mycobacteroides abscessus subsp. massiliense]